MKKIMIILACLLWTTSAWGYDFTFATNAETLSVIGNSMNLSGTFSKADSIRLQVYQNKSELSDLIYGYGSSHVDSVDGQTGNDAIQIAISFDSLDGATSSGIYQVEVTFKKNGQDTTAWTKHYSVLVGYQDVNIASVDADAIEAGDFNTAAINADAIATNAIGATELAANCIGDAQIATGAINADAIAPSAIGASELATNAIGNAEIAPRAFDMTKFDTASVAAYYGFAIWLDDAASNTNSIVGIDGTPQNPVSTLAAARILADSMRLKKYYITNNSSFTLDATYENWCFNGIEEGNEINFGSQDVDNSHFEHLMVAGVQGGTGLIWLDECYLNAADSLECIARNSWFSDTISVRVADIIVFDQCYSNLGGNDTPGLDFNSAAGTINVSVRHYSGGLALFNMTSNHTISYETDGQLIIDGSCTSANITARGNMDITNNGTTINLTDNAVFNKTELVDDTWDEILTGATHNIATSAGRRLRQLETGQVLLTGTINTANDSTATLGLSGNYPDGFFVHTWLVVTVGTDSVQIRSINGYTGATDSVDMAPSESWVIVPANGDAWEIVASASVNVADLHQVVLDEIWGDSRPDTLLSPYRAAGFNGNYILNGGLFLDSLWVVNTAGNAVYFTATSGRALYAFSSGGGDAVRFTSAGGSGHGLSLVASSGNGLNAVSSSGNEIDADIVGDITGNVSGSVDSVLKAVKLGNIESGTIDSGSVDENLFYKFWAYDDSTAPDLDNELSEWLQNNLAGGAAALPDSVVSRIDSILVSLGYDATDLHTKVDNLSLSGGGTEPETLIVLASADSTQLQGVRVTIRTIDQSTVKVDGLTTDVNGKLILDLDADSFFVALSANNYIQKNDTIVVAGGGQTDTLFMEAFDPGSPSSADLCIVYGWVYDIHGDSVKGAEVTVEILSDSSEVGITSDGVWINLYSYKRKTETDVTGKFSLEVYKTSALSDTSSTYLFSIKQASGRVVRVISDVPDSSTFKLTK